MHIQTHENCILAKACANVFLIYDIYRMWPLAASKAGIPVWIFYLLIFEDRLKRKKLQIYIQITLYFGILPKPYLQHLPQKQHQSNLVFLYICNFGLVFNAETQLNVSIYTVEICKVAGTALIVHAVIHNDMHNTTLFHRFKTQIYIYTWNQQIEYSNRPTIPVIFTCWWNNSYVVS